jgi:hypothetical protein
VDDDPGWRVEGGEEWEMHGTETFSRQNVGNQPEIPLLDASTARTRTSCCVALETGLTMLW